MCAILLGMKKIAKLCTIMLMGITLFGFSPFVGYAFAPFVSTGAVTNLTQNSATLNGSVNADSVPTSVWFEYGTQNSLINPTSINAFRVSSGNSSSLLANISGLNPNTTYYFRAVAQNSEGRVSGNIFLFTTTSLFQNTINAETNANFYTMNAITEPASAIGNTSVELNSTIYVNSAPSNTYFEWGTDQSLSNRTTIVSTGEFPVVKHIDTLSSLTRGTKYYFRAVTENATGRVNGAVLSFTTRNTTSVITPTKKTTTDANTIQSTSSFLGANVFGAGFLPTSLFGWLLLLALIFVLIILGKTLYGVLYLGNEKTHQ
jgi:hypothetical protein